MTVTVRRTLWLAFALFVLYGGTIPFHFSGSLDDAIARLRDLPLNPLVSPDTGRRPSIPDVVQNILLYLPFGVLGFLAAPRARGARRVLVVTLLGAALSIIVEALQLLTADRVASVVDVLTNTTGAFAGALAAHQFSRVATAGLGRLKAEGLAVPELRPLAVACAVAAIAAWQPFDVTLDVGTVVSKVRAVEAGVWQLSTPRDEGLSILVWSFFAMTLASYLSVLGERRAAAKTALVGSAVALFMEASQILIGSRMPGLWDALVASAGVMLGTGIWSMSARVMWPGLWLAALIAVTAAAAAMLALSPFQIAPHYQAFGWFPLLGYYTRTTFETVSHVCELMLVYFPLAFWLGDSRRGLWSALARTSVATVLIAAPIEVCQGLIVGRYPDVSDVGVSLLGAWIGAYAVHGTAAYNGPFS